MLIHYIQLYTVYVVASRYTNALALTVIMSLETRWVDGTPTSEVTWCWSHPGHYLVEPYTWPWSPKGQGHIWPWIFKCQGHGQGQTHWSHSRPGVQSICLLFVSWQSDHFWLRYSKFHIWPWKFKVKVMAKVTTDGHIWGLEFNRYVCFSFCGNGTIFGRGTGNSIFDLEISRSRSWPRSNPVVTFGALRSICMFAFRFVAIGPFLAEI